jgi:hypothetical protein
VTPEERIAKALKTANSICSAAFAAVNAVCPATRYDANRITGFEMHLDKLVITYADGRKVDKYPEPTPNYPLGMPESDCMPLTESGPGVIPIILTGAEWLRFEVLH